MSLMSQAVYRAKPSRRGFSAGGYRVKPSRHGFQPAGPNNRTPKPEPSYPASRRRTQTLNTRPNTKITKLPKPETPNGKSQPVSHQVGALVDHQLPRPVVPGVEVVLRRWQNILGRLLSF